jgi:hypothetical protein
LHKSYAKYSGFTEEHYYICDFQQMRKFVLDFDAVGGKEYKNSRYWRADIQLFSKQPKSCLGYFRWGDEPLEKQDNTIRVVQLDNIDEIINSYEPEPYHPTRAVSEVSRIVRDTNLAKQVKNIHKNQCQICGTVIGPSDNEYSEVHHIMPLGIPHNGPDVISNMIVLCPNHHAEFDYGFIAIEPSSLQIIHIDSRNQYNGALLRRKSDHKISKEYLKYHYDNIELKDCVIWQVHGLMTCAILLFPRRRKLWYYKGIEAKTLSPTRHGSSQHRTRRVRSPIGDKGRPC